MRHAGFDLRKGSPPSRWAWYAVLCGAVVALAIVGWAAWSGWTLAGVRSRFEDQQHGTTLPAVSEAPRAQHTYDETAAEFLVQSDVQWPAYLTALEAVQREGVVPVAVEGVAAENSLRVDVEFSDYPALLTFLADLNAGLDQPLWTILQAREAGTSSGGRSLATLEAKTPLGQQQRLKVEGR